MNIAQFIMNKNKPVKNYKNNFNFINMSVKFCFVFNFYKNIYDFIKKRTQNSFLMYFVTLKIRVVYIRNIHILHF